MVSTQIIPSGHSGAESAEAFPVPSQTHEINGRMLLVFDDLFDLRRIDNFANIVGKLDFVRRPSFDRELSVGIDRDAFIRAPFLHGTTERLVARYAELFGTTETTTRLSHVYAAAMTSSARPKPHRDNDAAKSITFLYYANARWLPQWGGETVFYIAARRPCTVVGPRPGRLAMFHSNILHRGGAPHRDAPAFRYTISIFYYPRS